MLMIDKQMLHCGLMSPSSHWNVYLQMCNCVCVFVCVFACVCRHQHNIKQAIVMIQSGWILIYLFVMRQSREVHSNWSMPFKNGAGQLKLIIQLSHIRVLNESYIVTSFFLFLLRMQYKLKWHFFFHTKASTLKIKLSSTYFNTELKVSTLRSSNNVCSLLLSLQTNKHAHLYMYH